jgi:hypothetical protein
LKHLNSALLGDSMLKPDGTPWLAEIAKRAPKLNWDDTKQIVALPLGNWLKTDLWDDKTYMLNAKRYAPMNAWDKMPFEVTAIYYRLDRFDAKPCPSEPQVPGSQGGTPGTDRALKQCQGPAFSVPFFTLYEAFTAFGPHARHSIASSHSTVHFEAHA